jgi:glycosyltransferase involved in cell wall biosynthesis
VILQHNPFFFENPGFSIWDKSIYFLKKFYIKSKSTDQYSWIVQTPRIKEILIRTLGVNHDKIFVKPFFESTAKLLTLSDSADKLSFIYAADGVPQKNHIYLFRVWEKLFRKHKLAPELHLTIPWHKTRLVKEVNRLKALGLRIVNHGFVSVDELNVLYSQNRFLVFPSLSESFGLPLVEAAQCGLKVIGSDLPFIYQVIEPSAVFNPAVVDSLCKLIISIDNGIELKETRIRVENNIEEVMRLIENHDWKS